MQTQKSAGTWAGALVVACGIGNANVGHGERLFFE
jgi:hypothetical protein